MNRVECHIYDYVMSEILWWHEYEDGDIFNEGIRYTFSDETIGLELIPQVNRKFNIDMHYNTKIDDMNIYSFCRHVRKHICKSNKEDGL